MTILQTYGKKSLQVGLNLIQTKIPPLVAIFSILIFGLAYFARVEEYNNDPALTLLTSQAIVEHQTLYVDWYKDKYISDEAKQKRYYIDFNTDNNIIKRGGHYYHYSIGTGIFSVPFVWVANLLGLNMSAPEHEFATQNFIAAFLCGLIFIVVYRIGRCYLEQTASLVIALISVLGSSLISILGVGLWNLNFTVLFICLALLHLVRFESKHIQAINPGWLAFLLASAYVCRPTAGFFIVAVFVYLFFANRRLFLQVMAVFAVAFVAFVVFSWFRGGELLPSYYSPQKIRANLYTPTWLVGLYGNLLSPSRGLFSFTPYLILVVGAAVWHFQQLKNNKLVWMIIVWFCMHIFAVSTRPDWWGGHTYGPRFSTDLLPGLILLTILVWHAISQRGSEQYKKVVATGYLALGLVAIFIHTYQGLYNPYTKQWNKHPNIGSSDPKYLLSWQYPQFLASKASLRQRNIERHLGEVPTYSPGDIITHRGGKIVFTNADYVGDYVIFYNWFPPEQGWRWAAGPASQLVFKPGAIEPQQNYTIEIVATALQPQTVGVRLNDAEIGQLELTPFTGSVPPPKTLTVSGSLFKEGQFNQITFNVPNAPPVEGGWETRTQGMAFVSLKVYPQVAHRDGVYYFESEFFKDGFSSAEEEWRWTDNVTATVTYPIEQVEPDKEYTLQILSGAMGTQNVAVAVNGVDVGTAIFNSSNPQTRTFNFSGHLLNANGTNRILLTIPNAAIPPGDTRRLGLALVSLKIGPAE